MKTNWNKTPYFAYRPGPLKKTIEGLRNAGYKAKLVKEGEGAYSIYACSLWLDDNTVEGVKTEITKLQEERRSLLERTAKELRSIEEDLTRKQSQLENALLGHSLNKQKGI